MQCVCASRRVWGACAEERVECRNRFRVKGAYRAVDAMDAGGARWRWRDALACRVLRLRRWAQEQSSQDASGALVEPVGQRALRWFRWSTVGAVHAVNCVPARALPLLSLSPRTTCSTRYHSL